VVFTVPHELNSLWRFNRKRFADALFTAATGALKKLLADPKYLGGTPGMLAALHTWSQTLATHVHLHVLVTAGGLDADRQWRPAVKSCLLPRKVLMIIFRGKLRSELLLALQRGQLHPPPDQTPAQLRGLLNKLGRSIWNVKLLERYDHGAGVVTYLARYLKGGPIAPSRFISVSRSLIRFRSRGNARDGEGSGGQCRLPTSEFLTRLLNHVPPRGMQLVRGYGLYAGSQRERLNVAREVHDQVRLSDQPRPALRWHDLCERLGFPDAAKCQQCQALLEVIPLHGIRAPPPSSVVLT
jgi:hypothetical protein